MNKAHNCLFKELLVMSEALLSATWRVEFEMTGRERDGGSGSAWRGRRGEQRPEDRSQNNFMKYSLKRLEQFVGTTTTGAGRVIWRAVE